MRTLVSRALALGAVIALPLLLACSGDQSAANPSAGVADASATVAPVEGIPAGLARADFDVNGMDCGGCVIGTRAALRKLEGVRQADASYDDATGKGTAWALYDPAKISPEQMIAAIGELGYAATPRGSRS